MTVRKFADATRALLRTTLLEAADALLAERAWAEISMADIAAEAGVSRQTLYNEFGSREKLAQAYALQQANLFLSSVEAELGGESDPQRALAKAFARFLREADESALVRAIVTGSPGADELFAMFTTRGAPIVALATSQLSRMFRKHWRVRESADVAGLAELIVRVAISHASSPGRSRERAARTLASLLGPYLRDSVVG